jgi:hypothetical protein
MRALDAGGYEERAGRWQQRYYLEPLGKPGDILNLEMALRYHEPGQPVQTAHWKLPVRVTTEIPSASMDQVRPVTGPEPVPPAWSWRPAIAWLETALVLAVFCLIIGEMVRRRWRRAAILTAEEWALGELKRLAGMELWRNEEVERFATLLSDVLRRYLELRFRLQAPRQTTAEFLEMVQRQPDLGLPQQALLRELLERCDLAKFARLTLSVAECRELGEKVRAFVVQTSPATEVALQV